MFSNLPNPVALDIILFQRIVELIWSMYMSGVAGNLGAWLETQDWSGKE